MQQEPFVRLKNTIQRTSWELLRAVEELERISQSFAASEHASPSIRVPKGQLVAAVSAAVSQMTNNFTAFQVKQQMINTDPTLAGKINDSSLSSALSRLGTVEVATPGSGRRPTRFRFTGEPSSH